MGGDRKRLSLGSFVISSLILPIALRQRNTAQHWQTLSRFEQSKGGFLKRETYRGHSPTIGSVIRSWVTRQYPSDLFGLERRAAIPQTI